MSYTNGTILLLMVLLILSPFTYAGPDHLRPPPEKESWFEQIIEYIIGEFCKQTKKPYFLIISDEYQRELNSNYQHRPKIAVRSNVWRGPFSSFFT